MRYAFARPSSVGCIFTTATASARLLLLATCHLRMFEARKRRERLQSPPDGPLGRVATMKQVVHIGDIRELQSYLDGHPIIVEAVELGRFRTALAVPMLQ